MSYLVPGRSAPSDIPINRQEAAYGDSTGNLAVRREYYTKRIKLVESAAWSADSELAVYILECVTKDRSYAKMVSDGIPCGRDYFYERYRKFFYILDKTRE